MENKSRHESSSKESPEKRDEGQVLRKLGLFAVILGDLVAYMGGGIGLGYYAWSKWGAPWWIILVFSGTGLTLAFYRIYQLSQKE